MVISSHVKIGNMPKKIRIDQALVDRSLAEDLDDAKRLVMSGKVLYRDQVVIKSSREIQNPLDISLKQAPRFVSRGGEKLQEALNEFQISLEGKICADIGASTGGFTDCLLKGGARRVYAVDVGYGVIDWGLRNDERVVVMERTNARSLQKLPEPIDFLTMDVSFISLTNILPNSTGWFSNQGGEGIVLIKPQFEATREESARGAGVIKDPAIHQRVLAEVLEAALAEGYQLKGLIRSPLLGPDGNSEFLAWLVYPAGSESGGQIRDYIARLF
jgi:23S rRNA (cytidine1920-2'-O)/16S rRNA (cytidine1409-2'-O)-methyltransferase